MNLLLKLKKSSKTRKIIKFNIFLLSLSLSFNLVANIADQTNTYSKIYKPTKLAYKLVIKPYDVKNLHLPALQSYSSAVYQGQWIIMGGLYSGQHIFNKNNKVIYIIDPYNKKIWHRKLSPSNSYLTTTQIIQLLSTNAEFYQTHNTLYIVGGYGRTIDKQYKTFNTLSAINLSKLIQWVKHPQTSHKLNKYAILQIQGSPADNINSTGFFQVTGGEMLNTNKNTIALIFGQSYTGPYVNAVLATPVEETYTKQVRTFNIRYDGYHLNYKPISVSKPNDNFRRRDLNIFPTLHMTHGIMKRSITALAGVFTTEKGVWTVPVTINKDGKPKMLPIHGFKQAMNQYKAAELGMFSKRKNLFSEILLGGITRNIFNPNSKNHVVEKAGLTYTNQITAYVVGKQKYTKQYYLTNYPIDNKDATVGRYYGTNAQFFINQKTPLLNGRIINYDKLTKYQRLGFIYGGILVSNDGQPNTASNRIFQVFLIKK